MAGREMLDERREGLRTRRTFTDRIGYMELGGEGCGRLLVCSRTFFRHVAPIRSPISSTAKQLSRNSTPTPHEAR